MRWDEENARWETEHRALYRTDADGRGLETWAGFELIGHSEAQFRRMALMAMELVFFRGALACAFTHGFAFVEDCEAIHSPYTNNAVRSTREEWSPKTSVDRLWGWLNGHVPEDVGPAKLREGQLYVHTEQHGAEHPPPPERKDYSKGFIISPLVSRGSGILVRPAWVKEP